MSELRQGIAEYLMHSAPETLGQLAGDQAETIVHAMGGQAKFLLDGDSNLAALVGIVAKAMRRKKGKATPNELDVLQLLEDWRAASVKSRPYYLSLPVWPNFAAPNNTVDGLLPTCRVLGWDHFVQVMRDPGQNKARHEVIYRGQRGYNWSLASTLTRQFSDGRIPDGERDELLTYFRLAMRGRGPDLTAMEDDDVWAYGQHVGLATPLLDWSKSPFVSLYFAFAEADAENTENHSRAIFCLDMTRLKGALPELFIEPRSNDNSRLVNQAGLFTLTPSGSENFESYIINSLQENTAIDFDGFEDIPTPENGFEFPANEIATKLAPFICKIHIPNVGRTECLAMLRKMNIHHGSLFPDPFGAAQYCNDWLLRKIREDQEEQRAALEERRIAEAEAKAKRVVERTEDSAREAERVSENATGSSLADQVMGAIARHVASIDENVDAEDWAKKIIQNYSKLESIDWVLKESTRANVKRGLSRQLGLLGAGSSASSMADELLEIFDAEYRKTNNLNFEGKRKPEYDFFAAARSAAESSGPR